jgi:hypothetical protein
MLQSVNAKEPDYCRALLRRKVIVYNDGKMENLEGIIPSAVGWTAARWLVEWEELTGATCLLRITRACGTRGSMKYYILVR